MNSSISYLFVGVLVVLLVALVAIIPNIIDTVIGWSTLRKVTATLAVTMGITAGASVLSYIQNVVNSAGHVLENFKLYPGEIYVNVYEDNTKKSFIVRQDTAKQFYPESAYDWKQIKPNEFKVIKRQ